MSRDAPPALSPAVATSYKTAVSQINALSIELNATRLQLRQQAEQLNSMSATCSALSCDVHIYRQAAHVAWLECERMRASAACPNVYAASANTVPPIVGVPLPSGMAPLLSSRSLSEIPSDKSDTKSLNKGDFVFDRVFNNKSCVTRPSAVSAEDRARPDDPCASENGDDDYSRRLSVGVCARPDTNEASVETSACCVSDASTDASPERATVETQCDDEAGVPECATVETTQCDDEAGVPERATVETQCGGDDVAPALTLALALVRFVRGGRRRAQATAFAAWALASRATVLDLRERAKGLILVRDGLLCDVEDLKAAREIDAQALAAVRDREAAANRRASRLRAELQRAQNDRSTARDAERFAQGKSTEYENMANHLLKKDTKGVHDSWQRLRALMQTRIRSLGNKIAAVNIKAQGELSLPCMEASPVRVGDAVTYDLAAKGESLKVLFDMRSEMPQKSMAAALAEQSVILVRLSASASSAVSK